jgi:hypothetical protein
MAVLLSVVSLWPALRAAPMSAAETMQAETRRIVSQYKAMVPGSTKGTPSKTIVDGPLMGNGDMGVCISAIDNGYRFWLCKNDFWKLAHDCKTGPSGPRVFGGLDVKLLEYGGASQPEQRLYEAVTVSTFARGKRDNVDGRVEMRSWVAASENMLVVELTASGQDADVEMNLWVQEGNESEVARGDANGDAQWVTRKFAKNVEIPTEAACAAKALGAKGTKFSIKAGQTVTILVAMQSGFKSKTPLADVRARIDGINETGLAELKDKHAAWWRDFWAKSFVEIGDPLIEQRYYLSNYVMASASRDPEFPPPIFGTWNTTDAPGWFGDYHLNYNHQAPYYGLYSSNHLAQADPYHAPILDFMPRARWYAKNVLNIRGAYYPVGIGPKGIETTRNHPTDGYARPEHVQEGGVFYHQRSNGAYCLVNIAMRWYSTYDKDYATKLYPLVRDLADFWEDYLKFEPIDGAGGKGGRYVIYKDSVHERSGNGNDFNSIVSLGLVRNALELAIDMSSEMGVDAERHAKWKHILDHLSGWSYQMLRLPRGRDEDPNVLKPEKKVFRYTEKGTPWWRNNTLGIQHIYPAGAIGLDSPPEVLEVSRNTIDVMNRWFDTNGMNSFYPAAVRVGYDPKVILAKLREMIKTRSQPNGFMKGNPHGIENCSIVPNTIDEMLCMGHRGVLRLFPVWPPEMDARFAQIRAVGAFLVSAEMKSGVIAPVKIFSEQGRNCTMVNPWPGKPVVLTRDARQAETVEGDRFTFKTARGETIELRPGG